MHVIKMSPLTMIYCTIVTWLMVAEDVNGAGVLLFISVYYHANLVLFMTPHVTPERT